MAKKIHTDFQKIADSKGWTLKEIAALWGKSERQVSRYAANPDPKIMAAVRQLEDKTQKHLRRTQRKLSNQDKTVLLDYFFKAIDAGDIELSMNSSSQLHTIQSSEATLKALVEYIHLFDPELSKKLAYKYSLD
ncbi:hypothetical protein L1D14_07695 [Vibrio tubiashii]|uniref:hypothetical protein n=1 Tax=Vibrio tubiashii TaxID=29498 RepID=UPI001EFEB17A|nr:hypothetical protein [Vibrio tubiashii]MCG9576122.1 hypothetical protein [Vibrio tubiashii]